MLISITRILSHKFIFLNKKVFYKTSIVIIQGWERVEPTLGGFVGSNRLLMKISNELSHERAGPVARLVVRR